MMTMAEAEALRDRACGEKKPFGRETAQKVAGEMPYDGHRRLTAYRCPFGEHWHVGHLLSVEGLTTMAEAVRVLSGNGPGSESGTIRRAERREQRRRLREPQSLATGPAVRSEPEPVPAALRATEAVERFVAAVHALDRRVTRSVVRSQRSRRHR